MSYPINIHYELEVFRADLNAWHYNQRAKTLEEARAAKARVDANGPSETFPLPARIIEVMTTRTEVK